MSTNPVLLTIDGLVAHRVELRFSDFESMPVEQQIDDVSRLVPGRKGDGVWLRAVLEQAGVAADANYVTLHADRDDFHVSIPLAPVIEQAILVYRVGTEPLTASSGGPIRMLIQDTTACKTGELDDCANVKFLNRIELSTKKGRDTRPHDEAEHEALHARQQTESPAG